RTLSSLELPRAVSVSNGLSSTSTVGESPSNENQVRTGGSTSDGSGSHFQHTVRPRQKVQDPARDLSIQVLEKFSRVTRLARETTSHLFRESHNDSFSASERRNHNLTPHLYPSNVPSSDVETVSNDVERVANDVEKVANEMPAASDTLEFDKSTLVWGKPRQPPLQSEE
ncbi:hypothetical protein U1Q18_028339, partial [Sarracenia purpurea var. burkii]